MRGKLWLSFLWSVNWREQRYWNRYNRGLFRIPRELIWFTWIKCMVCPSTRLLHNLTTTTEQSKMSLKSTLNTDKLVYPLALTLPFRRSICSKMKFGSSMLKHKNRKLENGKMTKFPTINSNKLWTNRRDIGVML